MKGKTTIPGEGDRKDIVIYYNDIRSINFFLDTPLTPDEEGDRVSATKTIPGHQRRKGPSDQTPINVSGSTARYMVDPSLKSGNALPGRSIILKTTPLADVEATRQFTLKGTAHDFQSYFEGKFKYDTYCYFSEGGRHTFENSTAAGGE